MSIHAQDLQGLKDDEKPKWLPQVLERIERVSHNNATAKDFLDYTLKNIKTASETQETAAKEEIKKDANKSTTDKLN